MDLKIIDAVLFSLMGAAVMLGGFPVPETERENTEEVVFHKDLDEKGESIVYRCQGIDVRFINSGKEDAFRR